MTLVTGLYDSRCEAAATASRPAAARLWRWLRREIALRADRRRLEALDDAALADIGLSRGGLEGSVRNGRHARALPPPWRARASCERLPPSASTEWR